MRRLLRILLNAATVLSLVLCVASRAEETLSQVATLLQRELKIVTDLTALNLNELRDVKDGPWIVARFSPVKSETRFANDEDRRRFRARQEREPTYIRTVEGDVGETTPLSKDLNIRDRSFFFELPEYITISQNRVGAGYSEFCEDATVICRFRETKQETERYRPFYFIPPTWRSFVAPAMEFASRQDRSNFQDDAGYRKAQVEGLNNDNSLVVLDCWRRLLKEGTPTQEALSKALKQERVTQAAVTCTLLRDHPDSKVVAQVHQWIKLRKNREELLGIGVGALAAYNSLGLDGATVARELRSKVAERASELPANPAVDAYLKFMLDGVSPSLGPASEKSEPRGSGR